MPYAQVEGGIAVLYENEWYLATPMSNATDENTITFDGVINCLWMKAFSIKRVKENTALWEIPTRK